MNFVSLKNKTEGEGKILKHQGKWRSVEGRGNVVLVYRKYKNGTSCSLGSYTASSYGAGNVLNAAAHGSSIRTRVSEIDLWGQPWVGRDHKQASKPSCSGVKENWSINSFNCGTWPWNEIPPPQDVLFPSQSSTKMNKSFLKNVWRDVQGRFLHLQWQPCLRWVPSLKPMSLEAWRLVRKVGKGRHTGQLPCWWI